MFNICTKAFTLACPEITRYRVHLVITADFLIYCYDEYVLSHWCFWNIFRRDILKNKSGWVLPFFPIPWCGASLVDLILIYLFPTFIYHVMVSNLRHPAIYLHEVIKIERPHVSPEKKKWCWTCLDQIDGVNHKKKEVASGKSTHRCIKCEEALCTGHFQRICPGCFR